MNTVNYWWFVFYGFVIIFVIIMMWMHYYEQWKIDYCEEVCNSTDFIMQDIGCMCQKGIGIYEIHEFG